jgi:GWxTD domain-containing protein
MRSVYAFLLLVLSAPAAYGQQMPVQVTFDYGTFAYDGQETLVDLFLAFEASSLAFQPHAEGGFVADVPIYLRIAPASVVVPGALEPESVWADSSALRFGIGDTLTIAQGQQFVHLQRAAVPPGEYAVELTIPAEGDRPEVRVVSEVRVPTYPAERVGVSDLLLASRIATGAAPDDPFYRNGLSVQPNAAALFGEGMSTLYFYAEAYNTTGAAAGDQYRSAVFVTQANKTAPVEGLEKHLTRAARPVDVLVGTFDLASLPTGSYFLRLHVLDPDGAVLAERSRKFFHYNPSVEAATPQPVAEQTFEASRFAQMSDEEVGVMLEQLDVVLTESERRRARSLTDVDAQRRFLRDAWALRDPNPNTSANEFLDEFYTRVELADSRFTNSRTEGWRSDRGRVLLRYGLPPETEQNLFDRGIEPHEIWTYNNIPGEGQAVFVFADERGFGDFRLIHSTVRGERNNPNWQAELAR